MEKNQCATIGLGLVVFLLFLLRRQSLAMKNTPQVLYAAGVPALSHSRPQFLYAQVEVAAAHISDELQLRVYMLIRMESRTARLTRQRLDAAVEACFSEVAVGLCLVVLTAGARNAEFFRVAHQRVANFHILCYATHEI